MFWLLIFQVLTAPGYRVLERAEGYATNAIKRENACAMFKNLDTWHDADADRTVQDRGSSLVTH